MFRKASYLILMLTLAGIVCAAAETQSTAFEQAIDRISAREAENFKTLQAYSPMVETYIQELMPDKEMGMVPAGDHYFLGRATFKGYVRDTNFLGNQQQGVSNRFLHLHYQAHPPARRFHSTRLCPDGSHRQYRVRPQSL